MKFRPKACCFVLPLGRGCLIISLILLFFEAIAPPLRNPGPQDSLGGRLAMAYRILNLIHTLGCLVLFLASFVRDSGLVLLFLITFTLHILLMPFFLWLNIEQTFWSPNLIDTSIGIAGEILSLYFFAMAVLYYRECKHEVVKRYRGSVTFAPDVP